MYYFPWKSWGGKNENKFTGKLVDPYKKRKKLKENNVQQSNQSFKGVNFLSINPEHLIAQKNISFRQKDKKNDLEKTVNQYLEPGVLDAIKKSLKEDTELKDPKLKQLKQNLLTPITCLAIKNQAQKMLRERNEEIGEKNLEKVKKLIILKARILALD